MKHRLLAVTLLATVALFNAGCAKQEGTSTTDTATTPASTDNSATAPTDTAATSGASLSADDRTFMEKTAIAGLFEVAAGTAVSPKAKKPDVKSFADRMVADHSTANDELKQLSAAKGVTLPADMDDEHRQKLQTITSASDVDTAYMEEMAKGHDKVVADFESASQKAQDPELKAWIDKTLQTLKDHQKSAHSIAHGK